LHAHGRALVEGLVADQDDLLDQKEWATRMMAPTLKGLRARRMAMLSGRRSGSRLAFTSSSDMSNPGTFMKGRECSRELAEGLRWGLAYVENSTMWGRVGETSAGAGPAARRAGSCTSSRYQRLLFFEPVMIAPRPSPHWHRVAKVVPKGVIDGAGNPAESIRGILGPCFTK
jgi:hypothetical protein